MSSIILKCRQCRQELLSSNKSLILTGHKYVVGQETIYYSNDENDCKSTMDSLYLEEMGLPDWILSLVNEAGWKKGKIKCPRCQARLGSFDFVSGRKCYCKQYVLPPVHVVKGKVDFHTQSTNQ